MSKLDRSGVVTVALAFLLAPLTPALIHAAMYLASPLMATAAPLILMVASMVSYGVATAIVLPGYLLLHRHQKLSLKSVLLLASFGGMMIGTGLMVMNEWGTGGYTYYGAYGYRLVEMGELTFAGYVINFLRILYFSVLGTLGGSIFWFFARRKIQGTYDNAA